MLPGFFTDPVSRLVRFLRSQVHRPRWIHGLPPDISFDVLDGLCRGHLGSPLSSMSYVHLSAWKPRGTYRLHLTTEAGATWDMIFKNELYSPDSIPALRALPVLPGPPEYAIYQIQDVALSRFLPHAYWSIEIVPGRHFQYILEDLGDDFYKLRNERRQLITAGEVLVELQAALKAAIGSTPHPYLAIYDRHYSEGLLEYALQNLLEYLAWDDDEAISELCRNWKQVVQTHQRAEFYEHGLYAPIHGDYNRSNIHLHGRDRTIVRVVDWEWAGIGVPHADLAALLKWARPADEQAVLELFARSNDQLNLEGHRRLLLWCQLERRLLDAGFLARQQLESVRRVRWLEDYIRAAATDVLKTVKALQGVPNRLAA